MTRDQAKPYVSYIVDDSGNGRKLNDDPHAVIIEQNTEFQHASKLIGWQCGFEPLFIAVHSYLNVTINDADAEDMAAEYLEDIGWFSNGRKDCDYIIS